MIPNPIIMAMAGIIYDDNAVLDPKVVLADFVKAPNARGMVSISTG